MFQKNQTFNGDDRFLDATEAAAMLGVKISTLYLLTHRGLIPYYKPGKHLRFKLSEVKEYIENARFETR